MVIAQYLARRLREHGVKRFFGIPGGPSIEYLEAFRKEGIDFILTSHESAAAVMADVTARLTGVTGVCHGTFGPGATNLSTGVGGALLDRSPMLVLTSEMPDKWLDRTTQMNINHQLLFRPLTKATFRISSENACAVINESLRIANEEYPGPVHIGLPSDLANASIAEAGGASVSSSISEGHIDERAKVLIASSRKPLIAAGLTASRLGLGDRLNAFLENCRVPVVVTPMAKGIISPDHPCFGGVLFHAMSDRLQRLASEADLIIGLGYDPVEYNYESWMPSVPLVHFDTIVTDMPQAGVIQVTSHPDRWFEILSYLKGSGHMVSLAGDVRDSMRNELSDAEKKFGPVTAIKVLRDILPDGAVVTADVGSHLHLLGQLWDIKKAGSLVMTNGWSSMGFGLPAANAAALCCPGVPVVCITGDGGLLMSAGEIMTARRYGLKIIVIVLADGELNLIRVKEEWKGVKPYGTDLYENTLFSSDNFLGVKVVRVTTEKEMQISLREALTSEKSTIIETAIDPSVYRNLIVKN